MITDSSTYLSTAIKSADPLLSLSCSLLQHLDLDRVIRGHFTKIHTDTEIFVRSDLIMISSGIGTNLALNLTQYLKYKYLEGKNMSESYYHSSI